MSVEEHIVFKFQHLTPESRKCVLSSLIEKTCSNCGGMQFVHDPETGENVCVVCGLVQNNGDSNFVTSFDSSIHSSPTNQLGFGRSLGDTLPRQHMYRVLAKTVGGVDKGLDPNLSNELQTFLKNNVGLRARQIRIMSSSVDHPHIKKALIVGEQLCQEFGLVGDTDDVICFRNFYGKLLRKVCSLAITQKRYCETFEARRIAVTTFVYVWQTMEVQHKVRKRIKFQKTFPSWRSRYLRGVKVVWTDRYRIRKEDWKFVCQAVEITAPAITRIKKITSKL